MVSLVAAVRCLAFLLVAAVRSLYPSDRFERLLCASENMQVAPMADITVGLFVEAS